MDLHRARDRQFEPVEMDGCKSVKIARLFSDDRPSGPRLRHFRVAPGGHTVWHQHSWFHRIIVVRGVLRLSHEEKTIDLNKDDSVYIAPGEYHQFQNRNHFEVDFYCLIPDPEQTP